MLRYLTIINHSGQAEVISYDPLTQDKLPEFYHDRDQVLYQGRKALEAHRVKERHVIENKRNLET